MDTTPDADQAQSKPWPAFVAQCGLLVAALAVVFIAFPHALIAAERIAWHRAEGTITAVESRLGRLGAVAALVGGGPPGIHNFVASVETSEGIVEVELEERPTSGELIVVYFDPGSRLAVVESPG